MVIGVDFDGTIVEDRYPEIGPEIPFATDTLKMLINERHRLILWTVREGKQLEEALAWCRERGVEFYAVNRDYPEETVNNNQYFSRKLQADVCIADHLSHEYTQKDVAGSHQRGTAKRYAHLLRGHAPQEETLVALLRNKQNYQKTFRG